VNLNRALYLVLVTGMAISCSLYLAGLATHYLGTENPWLLNLATVILISTPVIQVGVAMIVFLVNREYYNAVVAAIVLMIMLVSVITGLSLH